MSANPDSPDRDGTDPEERLGRLCDELDAALAAGESIDVAAWAQRFGLPEADVRRACDALSAMRDALGDQLAESARAPIAPPHLPADYELLGELGRGGMGVVYRARQRSLDRELAVKVLRPGEQWFADAVARFEREAKSLARLRHRHIVSVHEVGRVDGFVYFTMDYIAGETLQKRLEDGPLTTSEAVRLLSQVASAIAYAHQKGVVHRDLKPANILLDGSGDAFVCDFGLARDLAAGGSGATLSGQLLGTPGYMSPEQALGDRARIGEASDVYALGAVLYECLTGAAPFAGLPLAQLMHAVIEREPLPAKKRNAAVPPDLEVICDKAMQKRPEDRYATVQALAEDLERFSIGREILARRRSGWSRTARLLRRNQRAVWSGAAAVLVLLVFGWWFVLPTVLRRQAIALAERLHDGGNAAGALTAYREAFAGGDAAEAPAAERLGYVRALVDESGRLYLQGDDDDAKQAAALADEAARVLGEVPLFRFGPLPEAEAGQYREQLFEQLRIEVLRDSKPSVDSISADELKARIAASCKGAGHAATMLLTVRLHDRVFAPTSREVLDALLTVLPATPRLPPGMQAHLQQLATHSWPLQADFDLDFALLDRLVAMAGDDDLPLPARRGAAALFDRLDWLPFVVDEEEIGTEHAAYVACMVGAADLDWLVRSYREVRDLDPLSGYRRRVQLVGQRLIDTQPAGAGLQTRHAANLRSWLWRHGAPAQVAELATWLREQADGDPRQWLLDQLDWKIAPEALRPRDVMARVRSSGARRDPLLGLLELTAPPGTRIPLVTPTNQNSAVVRWEAALGERPDLRRRLRVAMFVMIDGEPTPQLVWQHGAVIGPDAPIEWQAALPTQRPRSDAYIGRRISANWLQTVTPAHLAGSARLKWDGAELRLSGGNRITADAVAHGSTDYRMDATEVPDGTVGFFSGARVVASSGATTTTFFSLAALQPIDGSDEVWTTERWRAESAATIAKLTAAERRSGFSDQRHVVMATLFPMPEQRDHLRALHDIASRREPNGHDYFFDLRREAMLLAGDAEALALDDPSPSERLQSGFGDPDFWLRLALTTDDATLREAAFAQMKPHELVAGQLRTLAAARRDGLAVPEAFAAKLPPAYGPRVLWWSANAVRICLATANVLAVLVLLRALRRRALRRWAGTGLMLFGWGLTSWSLVIGSTDYNPIWIGHAVHIVGCAALCWGRPGALPVVTTLWWAGATIADATDTLAHPLLVWSIGALLLLSQLIDHLPPRRRVRVESAA